MSSDTINSAAMPLAYNTRDGAALVGAGVFRDAEGRWWSVQGRSGGPGKPGHISFVALKHRPEWLTYKDVSNLRMALDLNQMLYKGNIRTFRTQDEADEAFKQAHAARGLFVR